MSAPKNGDKPAQKKRTAPSRKKAPRGPKTQRDIGVKKFTRPDETLVGQGKVLPGSAFDMLGRKKKQTQQLGGERVKASRYEVDKKTGAGGETAVDDNTNDPDVAPDTRGDTPGEGTIDTDFDKTLWGDEDEPVDAPKPQEASNRVLKDLRPNVKIHAPAASTLKARAGAWGASKLVKSAKDIVNTAAHPTTNKADSVAREAFLEQKKRKAIAAEYKPTAEEQFRDDYYERHGDRVDQVPRRQAPVNNPIPPRGQPPQKNRRRSKWSPVFSSEEEDVLEDDDDDDDEDLTPKLRRHDLRRAKPASRPDTRDRQNQKATPSLPSKAVVDEENEDDDDEDDPIVSNNRRRRAKPASSPQIHHEDVDEDDEDDEDDDENDEDDLPIAQVNRRRRAQPAPPCQLNDIPTKPTAPPLPSVSKAATDNPVQATQDVSPALSDNAAIDQLMQLGAPPTQAQVLAHIPLAHFPTATTASLFKTIPASQPQPQPKRQTQPQPQPQSQAPPENGVAHAPQPKRARPTTTATTKQDTTPSPPHKKSRAAPKREPAKPVTKREPAELATKKEPAKPVAKREPAKPAAKPAAADFNETALPAKKKGIAAIAGKKGVAVKIVKKPVPKGRNKNKGYVLVTDDEGGSD
jgi:hypothetical protein